MQTVRQVVREGWRQAGLCNNSRLVLSKCERAATSQFLPVSVSISIYASVRQRRSGEIRGHDEDNAGTDNYRRRGELTGIRSFPSWSVLSRLSSLHCIVIILLLPHGQHLDASVFSRFFLTSFPLHLLHASRPVPVPLIKPDVDICCFP